MPAMRSALGNPMGIRFPVDIAAKLEAEADRRGEAVSTLVRSIVRSHFEALENIRHVLAADPERIRHVTGCDPQETERLVNERRGPSKAALAVKPDADKGIWTHSLDGHRMPVDSEGGETD